MRSYPLFVLTVALCGCSSTESTPTHFFETDHAANYRRVFTDNVPKDVTVVNSVVVGYSTKPRTVTTSDFEMELVVPPAWLLPWKRSLMLQPRPGDVAERKNNPFRPWYAPKPIEEYDAYRDLSNAGYTLHMLVEKTPQPDGRFRVFFSKR